MIYQDIEAQKEEKEIQRIEQQRIALQKNNEELDRICNKICLCIGWSLVLFLFCWAIYLWIFH